MLERRTLTMSQQPSPSSRKLAGVGLILLLIVFWAGFIASLARVVGGWPILVQAPFYLFMGIAWIIPLKPLIRWMETGRWRSDSGPRS
jgi:hypothetical protein